MVKMTDTNGELTTDDIKKFEEENNLKLTKKYKKFLLINLCFPFLTKSNLAIKTSSSETTYLMANFYHESLSGVHQFFKKIINIFYNAGTLTTLPGD